MFVCRNERAAKELKQDNPELPKHIRIVNATSMGQIMGAPPQRITVMPGVRLGDRLEGIPLHILLKNRQLTWGGLAVFIDLSRM